MEQLIYFMQLNIIKPNIEGAQTHVPGLLLDG